MPRVLSNHFREIEVKIACEMAWQTGSPVVEIIRQEIKSQTLTYDEDHDTRMREEQKSEQIMQPFNMFFKRILHLTAQRVYELCEMLGINEETKERIWTIMKL